MSGLWVFHDCFLFCFPFYPRLSLPSPPPLSAPPPRKVLQNSHPLFFLVLAILTPIALLPLPMLSPLPTSPPLQAFNLSPVYTERCFLALFARAWYLGPFTGTLPRLNPYPKQLSNNFHTSRIAAMEPRHFCLGFRRFCCTAPPMLQCDRHHGPIPPGGVTPKRGTHPSPGETDLPVSRK